MSPPDLALADRFRTDLLRLCPEANGPAPIALAVSGGPDSMAMLALAHAAHPGRTVAATVDHRLRPASAGEAAMVAACCAELGVPHATLAIETPPGASGNLQSWARQARYRLLMRWAVAAGVGALAPAHPADDQAETFLMRAARASGVAGLAGIRARTEHRVSSRERARAKKVADEWSLHVEWAEIVVLRPLLHWRRTELRAVAEGSGLPFVDDPSNTDERFERTRFRRWLEQAPWIDPVQVGGSARHVAAAGEDLAAISRWLWQQRALPCGDFESKFDVLDLPRGVRRIISRMAIEHVLLLNGMTHEGWRWSDNVESLLDALDAGKGATHAGVRASAKGTVWHFRPAPPRRSI